MADSKISALTGASTPLAGTEVLPIVQGGATVKVAVSDLTAGRAVSATALTASTGNLIVSTTGKGVTTGSSIPLGFGVNNGTALMTLSTIGYLGLGTASPEQSLHISSSYPAIAMDESDVAANNKKWWFEVNGGVYQARILNDAVNAASTWLKVTRSGTTVSSVEFPASDVTLNTGNLVIGTAGKGIDFSADGQAAGMTSELLDDYEEGTWTPTVTVNPGTATGYTIANSVYTKIGRQVTVKTEITPTGGSFGNGASDCKIDGLPFVAVGVFAGVAFNSSNYFAGDFGFVGTNGTQLIISSDIDIAVGNKISVQITYFV